MKFKIVGNKDKELAENEIQDFMKELEKFEMNIHRICVFDNFFLGLLYGKEPLTNTPNLNIKELMKMFTG